MAGVGLVRLGKELKMLTDEPPPGVCAWPVDDCITHLQAQIQGPEDTPYERGTFLLDLQIPDRYPFEPPKVRFVTPIYHPNIDSGGRICLDTLKMRPAGSWAPSMNVPTLLTTIRLLMAHPNGDDGLMPDITELFLKNPSRFADVARAHVEEHARQGTLASSKEAKAKWAPAEGPPAPAAAIAGDRAGVARKEASPRAEEAAGSAPTSSVDDKSDSSSAEKGASGGDKNKISEAEAPTAATATATAAATVAGGTVGETVGESAAPAAPGKGQAAAIGAAPSAVDAGNGERASSGGGVGGVVGGAAAAGENEAEDVEGSGLGDGSNAYVRNSDGAGDGSEGGESGKTGLDEDGASSDDGAWSDSDDEEGGHDDGPASAKRPRTAV